MCTKKRGKLYGKINLKFEAIWKDCFGDGTVVIRPPPFIPISYFHGQGSESQQQTVGNSQYGKSEPGNGSQYRSGSVPLGFYALQRDNVFPERPGQPECQFYMKTGDCKFGAVCRFHHPRERLIPVPDCVLSPLGLPLRPVSHNLILSLSILVGNLPNCFSVSYSLVKFLL